MGKIQKNSENRSVASILAGALTDLLEEVAMGGEIC